VLPLFISVLIRFHNVITKGGYQLWH